MLARTLEVVRKEIEPQTAVEPDLKYSGFPWWHALTVEPNGERKSAELLRKVGVHVYLPTYSKKICRRGAIGGRRLCAVMPGLLFVPQEMMQIRRRDEIMKHAHIRGYLRAAGGYLARIRKDQIEVIREIEAKLNIVVSLTKKPEFKIGQRVRFLKDIYAAFLGEAIVFEVANDHRIGISGPMLFGSAQKIYIPASEIEAV
jgi:hypothetical protein